MEWSAWVPQVAAAAVVVFGLLAWDARQRREARQQRHVDEQIRQLRHEVTDYVDERIRQLERRMEAGDRRLEGYCETLNRGVEARLRALSDRAYAWRS